MIGGIKDKYNLLVIDPMGVTHVATYEEYSDGETRLFVSGRVYHGLHHLRELGWEIIGKLDLEGGIE